MSVLDRCYFIRLVVFWLSYAKSLYDKNRQEKLAEIKRELSKPPFLRNKYKTKREFESAINLVNNRPFKYEIKKYQSKV
ncbi:hypothetical protein BSPWISOXPB_3904 [uncultured Gammaproteobacteria bacterium]|nr:hypothetical protein BSPWISOXPB_3904 [uncultured Gammaproteobacteria bacterium]